MGRTAIAIFVAGVLGAAGCGSTTQPASQPRPPVPVSLSIYIDNTRVSISPSSVGAGPILLIVTNQASQTESLTIAPAGSGQPALATTGPISPQAITQLSVNVKSPGDYTVGTGGAGGAPSGSAGIRSAALHIGRMRPSSDNTLLQP
jgi:hypothetical protein